MLKVELPVPRLVEDTVFDPLTLGTTILEETTDFCRPQRMRRLRATEAHLAETTSVEDVHGVVTEAARDVTQADEATLVLRDGCNCYHVVDNPIAPVWGGQRFPIEASLSRWALLNRDAAGIEDIHADERIPPESYRPTFVTSLALVPIRPENPIGAIGVYWRTKHAPTQHELAAMRELAAAADEALARIRVAVGHLDPAV